jgi:hypothetical protein
MEWEPDVGGGIKRIFAAGLKSGGWAPTENWRLGPDGDDLRNPPFFVSKADSLNFNRLLAGQ